MLDKLILNQVAFRILHQFCSCLHMLLQSMNNRVRLKDKVMIKPFVGLFRQNVDHLRQDWEQNTNVVQ